MFSQCQYTRNGLRDLLLADWTENVKVYSAQSNQPERIRLLGTNLVKGCLQELLRLPFTFLRPLFLPVPTFPRHTISLVSEDVYAPVCSEMYAPVCSGVLGEKICNSMTYKHSLPCMAISLSTCFCKRNKMTEIHVARNVKLLAEPYV